MFNFLPAGDYVITAELSGFKSLRQADVKLEIGQSREFDLKMEVGRLEEIVQVEAGAPLLDRTSPSIGTVIDASHLKELPLAGRHWAGLMLLAPGAINTGDGTHLSTRLSGGRATITTGPSTVLMRPASRIHDRTAMHG